ncbi:MAG: OmpA family protein [Oligoflexia bacterium]|nr:OmpA family protein [Oligoflexia bacterium]
MSVRKFLKEAKRIEEQHRRSKEEPKHGPEAHDEGNWLISYADMMTLLCGFFIMLFSMAKLDDNKFEKVKEAMAKSFGIEYNGPATTELGKFLTAVLNENGIDKEATVLSDALGVTVAFQSTVFFDTLSADVRPQGRVVLERLIDSIFSRQTAEKKAYRIVVEGHTDSRPILGGTFPSNWELSGARAARVVRMFLAKNFHSDRLTAIGYGDTRPLVQNRTPAGTLDEYALAQNRRVVIRILEPQVDFIPFPDNAAHRAPAAEAGGASPLSASPPAAGSATAAASGAATPTAPAATTETAAAATAPASTVATQAPPTASIPAAPAPVAAASSSAVPAKTPPAAAPRISVPAPLQPMKSDG